MRKIVSVCGVAILSLVVASCGGAQENDAIQSDAGAPSVAEPVNATGDQAFDQSSVGDAVDAPRIDTLPATASSMPLVGVLGALFVSGAIVLRRYRRRE